jgi:hypothetical protein
MQPMTVRQVFYQATVRALVDKTEPGYDIVQRDLVLMRRSLVLPYHWLADNTRWQRKPRTVVAALEHTAQFYRRDLWADADRYVEIWLEKDALAVIYPVTSQYDVPLMVARGYASLSFLYTAAQYIAGLDVLAFIYHFGDHDPSGVNAAEKIEETLRELAPAAEIHFKRVAVTGWQIEKWNLPTRPTKTTNSRSKSWRAGPSVELDAIDPNTLRRLVRQTLDMHLPAEELAVLQAAEASEREIDHKLDPAITELDAGDLPRCILPAVSTHVWLARTKTIGGTRCRAPVTDSYRSSPMAATRPSINPGDCAPPSTPRAASSSQRGRPGLRRPARTRIVRPRAEDGRVRSGNRHFEPARHRTPASSRYRLCLSLPLAPPTRTRPPAPSAATARRRSMGFSILAAKLRTSARCGVSGLCGGLSPNGPSVGGLGRAGVAGQGDYHAAGVGSGFTPGTSLSIAHGFVGSAAAGWDGALTRVRLAGEKPNSCTARSIGFAVLSRMSL